MRGVLLKTVIGVLLLLLVPSTAIADWPMARQNPRRTGTAVGSSNLSTPAAYWRFYLGGSIGARGAMMIDVDSDGTEDTVFVTAGRVSAFRGDGTPLWTSDNFGIVRLLDHADLDGDGRAEIVARSLRQVFVIETRSGKLVWEESDQDMGEIGSVRLQDLDSDGLKELLVHECRCCKTRNGKTGFVYSFKAGYPSAALLWELPYIGCGSSHASIFTDMVGDGTVQFVLTHDNDVGLLEGQTGQLLAKSDDLGDWTSLVWCMPANVDASPGNELVCALNSNVAPAGTGHRIYVLRYQANPTGSLEVLWETEVGDQDGGMSVNASMVGDLDGDGTFEVIASGMSASGIESTVVLDAQQGAELARIDDRRFVGIADTGGGSIILTQKGTDAHAYAFGRTLPTPITMLWTLPDRRALGRHDWQASPSLPLATRIMTMDLNGDGARELITAAQSNGNQIHAYDISGAAPSLFATTTFPAEVEILATWAPASSFSSNDQIMVATSDGVFAFLDAQLSVVHRRVRFGGYHASGAWRQLEYNPVVGAIDTSGIDAIFAPDSRGALIRLNPIGATNAGPPVLMWERRRTVAPSIVPNLDSGVAGIACRRTNYGSSSLAEEVAVLRASDGSVQWSSPIGERIFGDIVSGRLDGDAVPDLVVQWGMANDTQLRTTAVSGLNGSVLWENIVDAGPNRRPAGGSINDWNGDGRDDFVHQFYSTRVLSGVDGTELATGGPAVAYFMPTIFDVDGDGADEVTLHGGYDPPRTLEKDLVTAVWTGADDDRPFPYGSVIQCGSRTLLVQSSLIHISRLKLTELRGTSTGSSTTLVLAGGNAYSDDTAADLAGARRGQLTSVYAHSNLTGQARPTTVVGSEDGWLYGVNPCSAALDFSIDFGASVGSIVFGDTDGDEIDEMLVSVADGYLYGVRQAPLPAPRAVLDTDPPQGVTQTDVDFRHYGDSLSARWEIVEGATGYQVAVAKADGSGIVTAPRWINVGNVTETTVSSLALDPNERYVFAVRALAGTDVSPDSLSDGVLLTTAAGDAGPGSPTSDAGTDGKPSGGCCSAEVSHSELPGVVFLVLWVVVALRPRRRRSP